MLTESRQNSGNHWSLIRHIFPSEFSLPQRVRTRYYLRMKIQPSHVAVIGFIGLSAGALFHFVPSELNANDLAVLKSSAHQALPGIAQGKSTRKLASSTGETANIRILNSIPLVAGLERKRDNEDSIAATLIQTFKDFADKNRTSSGELHRGTHAKGTCFAGDFNLIKPTALEEHYGVPKSVVSRLKKSFFASEGTYPASMRFANADGLGRLQSDATPDIRGFSFSVQTPDAITDYSGTHRQDFMFNSAPAFATGGIHEFLELVKVVNDVTYHAHDIPNVFYVPAVLKDAKEGAAQNAKGGNIKSYATEEYWNNLPYTHGSVLQGQEQARDLVKFKVTPCDGKGAQHYPAGTTLDGEYLQKEITSRAEAGEVCFLFQVQFFDIEQLKPNHPDWSVVDWVENGGLLWDEKLMPFYTVAQISIPKNSHPISCDTQYINTRLHSNPDNQPVGSIARVRTLVEEISRARRMKEIN